MTYIYIQDKRIHWKKTSQKCADAKNRENNLLLKVNSKMC